MKKGLKLLLGLFGIVGCMMNISAQTCVDGPKKKINLQKAPDVIRLVSYNVGVFNKYIQDDYPLIANMIREIDADVVCLNELDSCATRTRGVFQLKHIANLMGEWDFFFGPAMPFQGGTYGEGIMVKESAIRKFFVPLPQAGGSEPRVLVVVELPDFVIATTHLDDISAAAQIEQVHVINRVMREYYGQSLKPVFLGGDLNADPDSKTLQELKKAWLVLSRTDIGTYPSDDPILCIDYFLQLDNGVICEVKNTHVLEHFESGDVRKASDHLPIMLDIQINYKIPSNKLGM